MSFHTTNELDHFRFQGAYLGEIQFTPGSFVLYLDNVIILPENTTNRDIREMRCNNLELRIAEGQLIRCIKEGYKEYDANGNLMAAYEDTDIAPADYKDTFTHLCETESTIFAILKKDDLYTIAIDGEENTYTLEVKGTDNMESWDRYLNLSD